MAHQNRYELLTPAKERNAASGLFPGPAASATKAPAVTALSLGLEEGMVWTRINEEEGTLERTSSADQALAGFCVVSRRISLDLVMVARSGSAVNGLPALGLTVLGPKDSILLDSDHFFWVTQRVRPHVGFPEPEMMGGTCASCTGSIGPKSYVVTCYCGAIFHAAASEDIPREPAGESLDCLDKLSVCLRCGRVILRHEHLLWDPEVDE